MLGIGLLAMLAPRMWHPCLLWNTSPSVPIGLYQLTARPPSRGELAAIRLTGAARALAGERGYLSSAALLIKPVAAGPGDAVCRHGATVTVNGHRAARARRSDVHGRLLPHWSSCRTLTAGQVFVLSAAPDSFDSRYLGPIEGTHVIGVARAIWTRPPLLPATGTDSSS